MFWCPLIDWQIVLSPFIKGATKVLCIHIGWKYNQILRLTELIVCTQLWFLHIYWMVTVSTEKTRVSRHTHTLCDDLLWFHATTVIMNDCDGASWDHTKVQKSTLFLKIAKVACEIFTEKRTWTKQKLVWNHYLVRSNAFNTNCASRKENWPYRLRDKLFNAK